MFGDVTDLQQRHHLVENIKGSLHWRQNPFEMLQHIKNPRGGSIKPSPLYHGGGMTLRLRPRVKIFTASSSTDASISWALCILCGDDNVVH